MRFSYLGLEASQLYPRHSRSTDQCCELALAKSQTIPVSTKNTFLSSLTTRIETIYFPDATLLGGLWQEELVPTGLDQTVDTNLAANALLGRPTAPWTTQDYAFLPEVLVGGNQSTPTNINWTVTTTGIQARKHFIPEKPVAD
jgi:hypothetical protein